MRNFNPKLERVISTRVQKQTEYELRLNEDITIVIKKWSEEDSECNHYDSGFEVLNKQVFEALGDDERDELEDFIIDLE